MKKFVYLFAAAMLAFVSTSCSSCTQKGAADTAKADEQFASEQPMESGEYRANSYQYMDSMKNRMPFDGRMIVALDPANSGIYIFENGNRTNFKQSISLSKAFEKKDSVYVAMDNKENPVTFITGEEVDTLAFTKNGKLVKLAVERKPIATLTAQEAWTRITSKLGK